MRAVCQGQALRVADDPESVAAGAATCAPCTLTDPGCEALTAGLGVLSRLGKCAVFQHDPRLLSGGPDRPRTLNPCKNYLEGATQRGSDTGVLSSPHG